jgi:hypothetical protein
MCSPLNFSYVWVFHVGGGCVEGCILVEVDATVGELAEGSLLLDLSGLNGVLYGEGISA